MGRAVLEGCDIGVECKCIAGREAGERQRAERGLGCWVIYQRVKKRKEGVLERPGGLESDSAKMASGTKRICETLANARIGSALSSSRTLAEPRH